MPLTTLVMKLLGLSQAIHAWKTALASLEADRREKIARYADAIAATLARAAAAVLALERDPTDPAAGRETARELGRITGYVEDIVTALEHQFDGRKLAGIKRRLERLAEPFPPGTMPTSSQPSAAPLLLASAAPIAPDVAGAQPDLRRLHHLAEAEGYFRALADGLRT